MSIAKYPVSSHRGLKTFGLIIILFVLMLTGTRHLYSQSIAVGYSAVFSFGGTGFEPPAIYGYSGMFEYDNRGQYYAGYSDSFMLNSLPAVLNIDNMVVQTGQALCFSANHTLIFSDFTVKNEGSAVLIAGNTITLQPASKVEPGGYLHAYITDDNLFCPQPANMLASALQETSPEEVNPPDEPKSRLFTIFPNPTRGIFTVRVCESDFSQPVAAEIRNMFGDLVEHTTLDGLRNHVFDLSGMPAGIYLVRVIFEENAGVMQLVKH